MSLLLFFLFFWYICAKVKNKRKREITREIVIYFANRVRYLRGSQFANLTLLLSLFLSKEIRSESKPSRSFSSYLQNKRKRVREGNCVKYVLRNSQLRPFYPSFSFSHCLVKREREHPFSLSLEKEKEKG